MISFTKSYQTSDGQNWGTIDLAQGQELVLLFKKAGISLPPDLLVGSTQMLVKEKQHVLDILTTTAKSKPRARKINGGTKKRARAVETTGAPGDTET